MCADEVDHVLFDDLQCPFVLPHFDLFHPGFNEAIVETKERIKEVVSTRLAVWLSRDRSSAFDQAGILHDPKIVSNGRT